MKKVLFGITALAMSCTAIAGGGGSSWQPSVSPAQCVKNVPAPQVELTWNNIDACNEVISQGYASGVYVYGSFVYEGGQTRGYNAVVKPGYSEKLDAPTSIDGKKFTGTAGNTYQWLK